MCVKHKACPFDRKPNSYDCLFSNTDVVLDIAGMLYMYALWTSFRKGNNF